MSQKLQQSKKPSLKQRLDIYRYDRLLQYTWNVVQKDLPEYVTLYKKYDNVLVNQSMSKIARINNLKTLVSLGRILKEKEIKWETITRDQVGEVVSEVMQRWADPDGRETWHTKDHKKFLMQFVRWLKTGRRKFSRKHPEPEEILDINSKKVSQRLTREDMITPQEEEELLEACGENLRDKALIALHAEAGSRAGETLNIRIGHVKFLDNGGSIINVDGKTGDRPIHVIKSVPYLAAWLESHPYKDDRTYPFWIDLSRGKYGEYLTYYGARAMIKRRVEIAVKNAERKGMKSTLSNKRVFMTLFRHTEITSVSKWMSPQLLKKRHGWAPNSKMFENYEHLSQEDVGNAVFEHFGLKQKQELEEIKLPKKCHICKRINSAKADRCSQCGKALDLKAAMEIEEFSKKDKEEIEINSQQIASLNEEIALLKFELKAVRASVQTRYDDQSKRKSELVFR